MMKTMSDEKAVYQCTEYRAKRRQCIQVIEWMRKFN